jgi:hypothetical protein
MRLSFDRLWIVIALALPAFVSLVVALPAVDLAYQVRTGDLILATRALPGVDTFTFTIAGQPWTDQQWLAQVLLALGHRAGGWELLAVLRAGLVVAATGLLLAAAVLRGASVRTASILALVAFLLAAPALALRPQLFAIAVFAGLIALVAGRRQYPRAYLAAPLLVVAWASLHGSFVLAPVLLGYAWLHDVARGRPWRGSLAVLVAGIAATLVNPYGIGVWAYAAGIGANPVIAGRASEWQRTTPFTLPGALFYGSAALAAIVAWWRRRRLAWPDAVLLVTMAALGAWAVRGLAWWPAGALLVIAGALARSTPDAVSAVARESSAAVAPPESPLATPTRRGSPLNGVVAALLMVLVVAALPWWRPADLLTGRRGLLTYAPAGLAASLRRDVQSGTRVFVPEAWGSWFEWAVPEASYLVDARFELFPDDAWADLDVIGRGGTEASRVLDRRRVEIVVLPSGWTGPGDGWSVVYADADGQILVRTGAAPGLADAAPSTGQASGARSAYSSTYQLMLTAGEP